MKSDITINDVVVYCLLTMDEEGRSNFIKRRIDRRNEEKNLQSLYLIPISDSLKIYNEVDLVDICIGCKINLTFLESFFFISPNLPKSFDNHVEFYLDVNGTFQHRSSKKFTYVPYDLKILYKFFQLTKKHKNTTMPKKLRDNSFKILQEKEDINFDFKLKEYSDELYIKYDVDGFCGFLEADKENQIFTNLSIDVKLDSSIYSKNVFISHKKIKTFPHIKLGSIESHFGVGISLFMIFDEDFIIEDNHELLLDQIRISADKNQLAHSKGFTALISSDSVNLFLRKLKERNKNSSFFIECYGSKKGLISPSFYKVYRGLKFIFSKNLIKTLTFDLAVSIYPKEKKILFMKEEVFNLFRVRPNYNLFFCSSMSNFNKKFIKTDGITTRYKYGNIEKINLYSLIEDVVVGIRKINFLPLLTIKNAQNNLEGYKHCEKELISYSDKFYDIEDKIKSENSMGYRIEVSTEGRFLPTIFNIFCCLVRSNIFIGMNFTDFKNVFLHNLALMKGSMKGEKVNEITKSMIIETVMKEWYIKGTTSQHFLPKSIKRENYFRKEGITYLDKNFIESLVISKDDSISLLYKVLDEKHIGINKKFIRIFRRFIDIINSTDKALSISYIINQYTKDYKRYYKIEGDVILNYSMLSLDVNKLLNENDGSLSLSFFVEYFFYGEKPRNCKFPYIYMIDFFKKLNNMDLSDLLTLIYSVFCFQGINVGFIHRRSSSNSSLLVLLNLGSSNMFNKKDLLRSINQSIEEHKNLIKQSLLTKKGKSWSHEEKIRLIHGLIRYSRHSNRWSFIFNDTIYGFLLSRTAQNALRDSWKNIMRRSNVYSLVEKALLWNPSLYKIDSHFDEININLQIINEYKSLYELDVSNFLNIKHENFSNFINDFLEPGIISEQEVRYLETMIIEEKNEKIDLKTKRYRSFSDYNPEIFILQNRPRILNNQIPKAVSIRDVEEQKVLSYALKDDLLALSEIVKRQAFEIAELKEKLNSLPLENKQDSYFPDYFDNDVEDIQVTEISEETNIFTADILECDHSKDCSTMNDNESNLDILNIVKKHFKFRGFTARQLYRTVFSYVNKPSSIENLKTDLLYLVDMELLKTKESLRRGQKVQLFFIPK